MLVFPSFSAATEGGSKFSVEWLVDSLGPQAHPTEAQATAFYAGASLIRGAMDYLANVDRYRAQAAREILDGFAAAVNGYDASGLPSLHASEADDGALLIEWTLRDRRLGFSLEPQPEDSGWYFVLSNGSSQRYEAGSLDQLEMGRLVEMMLAN